MAQLLSLSDEDLDWLRAELAAGRPPRVWFTTAAVGVPAGGSAKIVAFADTAEGDFVQVRPTGSKDVLSFSPSELTRNRPPRARAATGRPPAKPAKAPAPTRPKAEPPALPAPTPPAPAPEPHPPAVRPTAAARPTSTSPSRAASPGRTAAPRRAPARAAGSAEVTVTLNSSESGEWTVEVVVGKKRAVRALPVQPADVAKAARALPAEVVEAVDRALDSARRQQQAKVAQLEAELARAQAALKDLG
jgi:hypothetical protein